MKIKADTTIEGTQAILSLDSTGATGGSKIVMSDESVSNTFGLEVPAALTNTQNYGVPLDYPSVSGSGGLLFSPETGGPIRQLEWKENDGAGNVGYSILWRRARTSNNTAGWVTVGYFTWKNSEYGSSGLNYTNGRLVFSVSNVSTGVRELDLRLWDGTIDLITNGAGSSTTIDGTELEYPYFSLSLTAAQLSSDSSIELQIRRNTAAGAEMTGAQLEFDCNLL